VFDVQNQILLTWQASADLKNVTFIMDSVGESSSSTPNIVLIGSNGDPDEDSVTEVTWEWADMAQTRKYERGAIPCAVVAQSGAMDQAAVRILAKSIMDACIAPFIGNDRTLNGLVLNSDITEMGSRTIANQSGIAVISPFTVSYFAVV
jgi:hypothetical protein